MFMLRDATRMFEDRSFVGAREIEAAYSRIDRIVKAAEDWAHKYEACSTESGERELHAAVRGLRFRSDV